MSRYDILTGRKPKSLPVTLPKKEPKNHISSVDGNMIGNLFQTVAGRATLAASMVHPIRQRLGFSSVARRILSVDPISEGAIPIYGKGSDSTAYYIDNTGENIIENTNGFSIAVPSFEVSSYPHIPLSHIRQQRGSLVGLIDRAIDTACMEIRSREQTIFSNLINTIIENNPDKNKNVDEFDKLTVLSRGFDLIEQNDLRVQHVCMNAREYTELRNMAKDQLDINTNREIIQTGVLATIWGAQISVSRTIPSGRIYFFSEPRFVGVLPIIADINVLSADPYLVGTLGDSSPQIGWSVYEAIGMFCPNSLGISSVTTINFRQH